MIVKYEDLIADPEQVMRSVAEFLGESFYPACLDEFSRNYDSVVRPSEECRKHLCRDSRLVDRRRIWEERLSQDEIRLIEARCWSLAGRLGYERLVPPAQGATEPV